MNYENLLQYAQGPKQIELLDQLIREPESVSKAADAIGMDKSHACRAIRKIKARAAMAGDSPDHDMNKTVPEPFIIGGVSTLYDDTGKPKMQWVKSKLSPEMYAEIQSEAYKAWASELPKADPICATPEVTDANLLNLYVLTDYHLGMLAWPEETGEPWDVYIAESMMDKWAEAAVSMAPKADEALFLILGDFLHWDGLEPITPRSKHILDADVRFTKLVRVAIRAIRKTLSLLLAKHNRVKVIIAEGNHDQASAVWLRESMAAVYCDESRIEIDTSPDLYYAHRWGDVGIYAHHGHVRKTSNIDTVFARKFRELWGSTKYAYAHMGHLHNESVRETNLMHITQHRTLAAKDAFASRGGWLSDREASVVTYHRDHGRVNQVYLSPDMLDIDNETLEAHKK